MYFVWEFFFLSLCILVLISKASFERDISLRSRQSAYLKLHGYIMISTALESISFFNNHLHFILMISYIYIYYIYIFNLQD